MRTHIWNTAHPFKRLVAFLIDVVPLLLLSVVISMQAFEINPLLPAHTGGKEAQVAGEQAKMLIQITIFIVWLVYCVLAELSPWAGTFGKRLMGLRVRDASGRRPTFGRAVVRNFTKILSIAPFGLGLLWSGLSKTRRTWHELISGTAVVER